MRLLRCPHKFRVSCGCDRTFESTQPHRHRMATQRHKAGGASPSPQTAARSPSLAPGASSGRYDHLPTRASQARDLAKRRAEHKSKRSDLLGIDPGFKRSASGSVEVSDEAMSHYRFMDGVKNGLAEDQLEGCTEWAVCRNRAGTGGTPSAVEPEAGTGNLKFENGEVQQEEEEEEEEEHEDAPKLSNLRPPLRRSDSGADSSTLFATSRLVRTGQRGGQGGGGEQILYLSPHGDGHATACAAPLAAAATTAVNAPSHSPRAASPTPPAPLPTPSKPHPRARVSPPSYDPLTLIIHSGSMSYLHQFLIPKDRGKFSMTLYDSLSPQPPPPPPPPRYWHVYHPPPS